MHNPRRKIPPNWKFKLIDIGERTKLSSGTDGKTNRSSGSARKERHLYHRECILNSAAELFSQKGYNGASVSELAEMIGVTKPFIYYYMKNKQDILEQICIATIDLPHLVMDEAFSEDLSPTDLLYKFVRRFAWAQSANQNYVSVFFRDELNLSPEVRRYLIKRRREFDKRLEEVLLKGVEAGEFHIADVPVTVCAIAGMVCWIFTWYKPDGRLTLEEVAVLFADLTLNMVNARRQPDKSV